MKDIQDTMHMDSVGKKGSETEVPQGQSPGISVIIPTFNEAANIKQIVSRCLRALSDYDMTILVVDDDSPDGTTEVARELFGGDERVRIIRRTEDPGLAQSVTDGFQHAQCEYCAVIDADLQHPPEKLPALLGELENGAQIAIGSRYVDDGCIENWSAFRKITSKGGNLLAKLVLEEARWVSDPMSGFFAIQREVVENAELDPQGYKILLEVLSKGTFTPNRVREVPHVFSERKRGESNLTLDEYKNFLQHLLLLWMYDR